MCIAQYRIKLSCMPSRIHLANLVFWLSPPYVNETNYSLQPVYIKNNPWHALLALARAAAPSKSRPRAIAIASMLSSSCSHSKLHKLDYSRCTYSAVLSVFQFCKCSYFDIKSFPVHAHMLSTRIYPLASLWHPGTYPIGHPWP